MKKILCIIVLLVSISKFSHAQDNIYGGLKLSPNYSIFIDKAKDYSSGIGYSIGYFEVLELSYKLNLQAEVNYSQNSFIYKVSNGSYSEKQTSNYNSVELPLMFKFRPSENFAIGIGYQFSFKSKGKIKTVTTDNGTSTELKETIDGISSEGGFLDANFKSGKTIVGLRILKTNKNFIEPYNSLNAAFYLGFGIF
jgi:hypothetical protein